MNIQYGNMNIQYVTTITKKQTMYPEVLTNQTKYINIKINKLDMINN